MRMVLVVDDEPLICRMFARCLPLYGLSVAQCLNEADVEKMLASDQVVHLLITDLNLRNALGTQIAEMVRIKYPNLPVIYTSGYSTVHVEQVVDDDEKSYLLHKPFSPDELVDAVSEALGLLKR